LVTITVFAASAILGCSVAGMGWELRGPWFGQKRLVRFPGVAGFPFGATFAGLSPHPFLSSSSITCTATKSEICDKNKQGFGRIWRESANQSKSTSNQI